MLVSLLTACSAPLPKPVPDATGGLNEAQVLYGKAHVLWRHSHTCSDPERAIAMLNSALDLEPEHTKALILRGRAYTQLGMTETAFDNFSEAIRIKPTADAYAWRAYALLCENNLKGARRDLDQALDIDDDSKEAWGIMGIWHLLGDDEKNACKAFEKADDLGDPYWLTKIRSDGMCR